MLNKRQLHTSIEGRVSIQFKQSEWEVNGESKECIVTEEK